MKPRQCPLVDVLVRAGLRLSSARRVASVVSLIEDPACQAEFLAGNLLRWVAEERRQAFRDGYAEAVTWMNLPELRQATGGCDES